MPNSTTNPYIDPRYKAAFKVTRERLLAEGASEIVAKDGAHWTAFLVWQHINGTTYPIKPNARAGFDRALKAAQHA